MLTGDDGPTATASTRILGGTHIRDAHEVQESGHAVYAGETTYSVEGEVSCSLTSIRSAAWGDGTVAEKDDTLRFTGSMRASPDKRAASDQSEWRMVDDDHYEVRSLVRRLAGG